MEAQFWESIAASGPVALVLAVALYLVARWGLKQQKEKVDPWRPWSYGEPA